MGLQDIDAVFERLDKACTGFLTIHQVRCFYEELYFRAVSPALVSAAATSVCGPHSSGCVRKAHFMEVLLEIDRRLAVEEQAYWDFQALDQDGDALITVHDAFLLCQEYLGEGDFLAVWRQFLASRDFPEDSVHLDELRPWLCELPSGSRCSQAAVQQGEAEALKFDQDRTYRDLDLYKHCQGDDDDLSDERNGYIERTKQEAERKLLKWRRRGLEAMLNDEGDEMEEWSEEDRRGLSQVSLSDVLQLLQTKYSSLQELVLSHMAQEEAGDEAETAELKQQLQQQLQSLTRSPELRGRLNILPGSNRRLPHPLAVMMEDLNEAPHLAPSLGPQDSSAQCAELFLSPGPTCGEMLQQLLERYTLEQRRLLGGTSRASSQTPEAFFSLQFILLLRQLQLLKRHMPLSISFLAVGQAERLSSLNMDRKRMDRARQEALGRYRLEGSKGGNFGRSPRELVDLQGCLDLAEVPLWERVVEELEDKQHWELQAAMELISAVEQKPGKLHKLSEEEKTRMVTDLRNQYHSQRASVDPAADRHPHVDTLQSGLGLLYHKLERELGQKNKEAVAVAILASVQQQQETEVDLLLHELMHKTPTELVKLLDKLNKNRIHELFDNIAIVVFGAAELNEVDKKCLDTINEKYDLIRERIFDYILKERFGDKLSAEDRDQRYRELKQKEAELRNKGSMKEMETLLGQRAKTYPSLHSLMGEDKATFSERLAKAIDKEVDILRGPSINLLGDVTGRCQMEREWFWGRAAGGAERQTLLLRLRLELFLLKLEPDCETALLALGLLERVEGSVQRHKADRHRQAKLNSKLMGSWQSQPSHAHTVRQFLHQADAVKSGAGTHHKRQMLGLKSAVHRQRMECTLLLQLLLDEGLGDLVEAAAMMDAADRQQRLQELRDRCSALDCSSTEGQEEYYSMLEECTAIKVVCMRELRQNAAITELAQNLLQQLQELQDRQLCELLHAVPDWADAELEKCITDIWQALTTGYSSNVLEVLTTLTQVAVEGLGTGEEEQGVAEQDKDKTLSDQELLSALDNKYDALRDKMIAEALMKELGEAEWLRLSEKERQKRLAEMRLKERQLRKEGKYDDLAAIFGNYLSEKEGLEQLLEENKMSQRQRFEERLRAKRQLKEAREAAGLSVEDELLEEMVEEEMKQSRRKNILMALEREYDAEKDALFGQLHTEEDRLKQEKMRQFALSKLRAEERRLQKEDNADSALLLMTLANQQSQQKAHSVEQERERQRQLARERLRQRKLQKEEAGEQGIPLTLNREPTMDLQEMSGQEGILTRQDRLEEDERKVLLHLMDTALADPEMTEKYQNMSQQELVSELTTIQQQYNDWRRQSEDQVRGDNSSSPENQVERQQGLDLLAQALAARMELERQLLGEGQGEEGRRKALEELQVALLADLQTKQLNSRSAIANALSQADQTRLEWLVKVQRMARQEGWYDNVAGVIFTLDDPDFVPQPASSPEPSMEELYQQSRTTAERDNLNPDEVLKNLQDNHEAKKQVVMAEYERQRRRMQEQLAAARASSVRKDDEAFTAAHMLRLAETQAQAAQQQRQSEQSKQRSLLQERLAARRQARQQAREGETEAATDSEVTPTPSADSRPPSQFSLKRERTQLSEVTEDEKAAVYKQLVRQQEQLHSKISQQQSKQEEMLKRRLEARKGKRENEAAALIGLGERQRTFLETSQKENRERQIAMIQDRVARVRTERTMTTIPKSAREGPGFERLAEDEGDDKMEERAKDLEDRLKQLEQQQAGPDGKGMSDMDRFKMIKERRRQKGKAKASGNE